MRLKVWRWVLVILIFFTQAHVAFGGPIAKNVFIVVGDQFRHDESLGDRTHKNVPNLWKEMIPNASHCVTFYGNPAFMAIVHLAIVTGSWKDLRRLKPDDIPEQPTIFEYFRKGLGKDAKSCYFITSKPEYDYLNFSNHEEYGEEYAATVEFTKQANNDDELYDKLTQYMKANHPQLVLVILGGAKSYDKIKRPEDVERYSRQLKEMDKNIYKIWQAIQADEIYKDKTDFFFLNDHGDLLLQADCDDECKRYLFLMALGPDIKKNFSTKNKWRQVNICATVGKILNFPTPYVAKDASVITDFLIDGGK